MIVLFTDFGYQGPYVGQMKAVLYQHAPTEAVVDLMHDAPAFDIRAAAFLLAAMIREFPLDTVFLCVVDPAVGSDRETAAVKLDGRWFVGPDNGLFSVVTKRADQVQWHHIRWRPERLTSSFHGRDLFAPIAARIAAGALRENDLVSCAPSTDPGWPEESAAAVYIDHYGNVMSGMRADAISQQAVILINGQRLHHARTFSEVPVGRAFWYENSIGLVEFAVNQGSAARALGIEIGTPFAVNGG